MSHKQKAHFNAILGISMLTISSTAMLIAAAPTVGIVGLFILTPIVLLFWGMGWAATGLYLSLQRELWGKDYDPQN